MSESKPVWKLLIVFILVISFTLIYSASMPGAPTIQGWSSFEAQLADDPFTCETGDEFYECVPDFPVFPDAPCDLGFERDDYGNCQEVNETQGGSIWDAIMGFVDDVAKAISWVFQWIGIIFLYIAQVFVGTIHVVIVLIFWVISLIVGFFGALLGMGAGFSAGMPSEVATMANVVFLGFTMLVFFTILRFLRGN